MSKLEHCRLKTQGGKGERREEGGGGGGGGRGQKSIGNVTKKNELFENLDFFEIINDVFHTYIFE